MVYNLDLVVKRLEHIWCRRYINVVIIIIITQATHAVLSFINGLTDRYDNGTEPADIFNEIVLILETDNMNILICYLNCNL